MTSQLRAPAIKFHFTGICLIVEENSDYENEQKDSETLKGFALLSYLVIWPLAWFLYPFEIAPFWFNAIFLLCFPFFVGSKLKNWALRNQINQDENSSTNSGPRTSSLHLNNKVSLRVAVGVVLIITLLVVGNIVVKEVKVARLLNSANELITKDKFDDASLKINQALEIKPRNIKKVYAVRERITAIRNGVEIIKNAQEASAKGDFISAITFLNRVTTNDRNSKSKAKGLISSFQTGAELQFEKELESSLRTKDFNGIVSLIDSYNRAFPESKKHEELRKTYVAKEVAQIDARRKAALSKLSKKYDSFQDITWYQSLSSTKYRNANAFYLYFGVSSGSPAGLRLVIQYYADDWLFIDSAKINVDGRIYDVGESNWERDNDSEIWEWIDEPLSDRSLIEAIIKSRSAVIRFEGSQYYGTRTISASQKRALRDVLDAYDSF